MKRSHRVATITAATLCAALLLAPAPGLDQLPPIPRQLTVFDGKGNVVSTIGEPDTYFRPNFSPDRTRVAVILAKENEDLWVFDLATGNGTQITSSQPGERVLAPVWSPDGSQSIWRQDGKEMFYLIRDWRMGDVDVMAVDVTTAPEFQKGTPRLLFRLTGSEPGFSGNQYIGPDGQRFVFVRPVVADTSSP